MALWLARAGRHGEHEAKFLDDERVYVCWHGLQEDLSGKGSPKDLFEVLKELYPDSNTNKLQNHARQISVVVDRMQPGDWVVMPSKLSSTLHFGEVMGPYEFHADGPEPYWHSRKVHWFATEVGRDCFPQDILYSFGAFLTFCEIKRNDAEKRIRSMAKHDWQALHSDPEPTASGSASDEESDVAFDLEQNARDQIAKLIQARFKGHEMARLVESVLRAQGYETHNSPPGPDHGVDIVAGGGAMGFAEPRICVQVKSSQDPVDRPTLDQLIGTIQHVQADHGLLVSWGGFKKTVEQERSKQFFRVRLWNKDDLIDQILEHYHDLEDEIRAELPLKRIWTTAFEDGEST